MNKTMKSILAGAGAAAVILLIEVLSRMLINGTSVADELKNWLNYFIAVIAGGSVGFSVWNKGQEKK